MRILPCHSFFLLPQWIKKNRYYLSISPYNRSYRRKGNETRILQGVQVLTKGYIKNNSSFQSTEERPLPYRVSAYSCFLLSGVKTVEQWVPLDCAFMTSSCIGFWLTHLHWDFSLPYVATYQASFTEPLLFSQCFWMQCTWLFRERAWKKD